MPALTALMRWRAVETTAIASRHAHAAVTFDAQSVRAGTERKIQLMQGLLVATKRPNHGTGGPHATDKIALLVW